MGWEDTIYDTTAKLEEKDPEGVKELLASYLDGEEDSWYSEWKNHLIGILLWNNVVNSPFQEYVDAVLELREFVKEKAKGLLEAYEEGESWNANAAQKEIASFISEYELKRIKAAKMGATVRSDSLEFQPESKRTWAWGDASARKVGLLGDGLHVELEMVNTETGESKKHKIDYEFDSEEVSKMFGTHGSGFARYMKFENVKGWEIGNPEEPKKTGEAGDSFMNLVVQIPFEFTYERDEGTEVCDDLVLMREVYMETSTGEIDHDGYWRLYRADELS